MFVKKIDTYLELEVFNIQFPEHLPQRLLLHANSNPNFYYGVFRTRELEATCKKYGIILNVGTFVSKKKRINNW